MELVNANDVHRPIEMVQRTTNSRIIDIETMVERRNKGIFSRDGIKAIRHAFEKGPYRIVYTDVTSRCA